MFKFNKQSSFSSKHDKSSSNKESAQLPSDSTHATGTHTVCPHYGMHLLETNPLGQHFDVGKFVGTAGPENIWKIYDAKRKADGKEASIFVFEKKTVEKLHKPKRKETISEILRSSIRQLERFRHPKILQVFHSAEECAETLAFASETVLTSLSSIIESHDNVQYQKTTTSCDHFSNGHIQSTSSAVGHQNKKTQLPYGFLDIELKYGILQITEALQFLHYSGKVLHRNICPGSILVTKRGTWKLAGMEFIERCSEIDGLENIHVVPWTSKIPKMGQPDLDYIAPETQLKSQCSILSDMFSLGMVITAIFNNGKPLLCSNHSNSTYAKQIDNLEAQLQNILGRVPVGLQEALQRLLSKEPRQRPTSQLLALIKYFSDVSVHSLQFLDVIQMKDPTQKSCFYRKQLREVLPFIPKKLWFQHIWPALQTEMKTQEVLAAVLLPILFIIEESEKWEFDFYILPAFRTVFSIPKSIQATVTLLENLHIVLEKGVEVELLNAEVLPMLFASFDSSTIQVQNAALVSTSLICSYISVESVRKIILPKVKQIYEKYMNDLKIIVNVLTCIEKIMDKLERPVVVDEILPLLYENIKLQDADIVLKVVHIYKLMLNENKKYGLSVNLMATRVMPSLLPQTVNPSLNLDQFIALLEVLQEMLDHIDRNQRNKLKLDNLTLALVGSPPHDHYGSQHSHHRRSILGSGSMFNVVPNVQIENAPPSGGHLSLNSHLILPHSGGQRKTSSAEDMINRKNSTEIYSDGSTNFLRVLGGSAQFPIRRLSDNTLMAPKVRLAPHSASALSSPGETLPIRRHSSIGPQERKNSSHSLVNSQESHTLGSNMSPSMGGSMPNTTFNTPLMQSSYTLSNSMSSLRSRRTSVLSSNSSVHSAHSQPAQLTFSGSTHRSSMGTPSSGILQQLGSGVYQLFGGGSK